MTGSWRDLPFTRAAQVVSVTAGRATYRVRMIPAFLIVGAQRCGTTSMYRALSQHPAVVKAVLHKGIHYFDTQYHRGPAWYRSHLPVREVARLSRRKAGYPPVTFESSPYYMFHPLGAERIHCDLPDVKLLVLVRDPVERAYSAYAHELARGFESEPFERALELEAVRLEGEAERMMADPSYVSRNHQHFGYCARGRYAEQLERLEGLFDRQHIHVVDSGDFFANPRLVYDKVLDFLGLPHLSYPVFRCYNARPRAPMSEAVRARLDSHFQPHDERLCELLDHVPSWRR